MGSSLAGGKGFPLYPVSQNVCIWPFPLTWISPRGCTTKAPVEDSSWANTPVVWICIGAPLDSIRDAVFTVFTPPAPQVCYMDQDGGVEAQRYVQHRIIGKGVTTE
eukprot:RCo026615